MTVTNTTQHAGVSSSPQSSNDRASMHNTPETKLTAFSPELLLNDNAASTSSQTPRKMPPAFSLVSHPLQASVESVAGPSSLTDAQDPFVMRGLTEEIKKTIEPPKFSPSAQTFTPRFTPARLPGDLGNINTTELPGNPTEAYRRYFAPLNDGHKLTTELNAKRVPEQTMSGMSDRRPVFSKIGQFSAESVGTRYIALTKIPASTMAAQVHGFFDVSMISPIP